VVITIEPKIEREKLLRLLGGGDRQQLSPSTRKKMSRWGAEMTELVEPWLSYEVLRLVETSETEITLEGDISFRSRKIARTLKGCSHAVVFAATIGPDIETRLAELVAANVLDHPVENIRSSYPVVHLFRPVDADKYPSFNMTVDLHDTV